MLRPGRRPLKQALAAWEAGGNAGAGKGQRRLGRVPQIVVEISPSGLDLGADWHDLVARATPNVFMHPVVFNALQSTGFGGAFALTAWDKTTEVPRLVGVWALRRAPVTPIGPIILTAPPNEYCLISNPVIDGTHADSVIPAFLDAIARDPALPKVIRLRYLDSSSESYPALARALRARGARSIIVSQRDRAFASPEAAAKQSGSTRKKLRQDWNRLAREGLVRVVNDRDSAAVVAAFETFLTIEGASWKSDRGTAVVSDERNARFARAMIGSLAAEGGASVALLMLDGRAIAAQVLLYSGRIAYTWKTGFDARYARFSPGALLVGKATEELFASGAVDGIESCSHYGHFMKQFWTGRRTTVDIIIDLGSGLPWKFHAAQAKARGRLAAQRWRNRAQKKWKEWRKRPPAVTGANPPEA